MKKQATNSERAAPLGPLVAVIVAQGRFFVEIDPSIARMLHLSEGDLFAEKLTNAGIILAPPVSETGETQNE